ncbi:hypothetical protein REPUB_Repub06bG0111100 [Reevesia pubescens]
MHEGMKTMLDNADAFIALLGGFGTLKENFQIASCTQLNIHQKPISMLKVNGFYNSLFSFLGHVVEQKFISQATRHILIAATTPDKLINQLQAFVPKLDPALALIDRSITSNNRNQRLDLTLSL